MDSESTIDSKREEWCFEPLSRNENTANNEDAVSVRRTEKDKGRYLSQDHHKYVMAICARKRNCKGDIQNRKNYIGNNKIH